MVSVKQPSSRTSGTDEALTGLLGLVEESLENLRLRASNAATQEAPESMGLCPRQLLVLCEILDRGHERIARRMDELNGFSRPHVNGVSDGFRLPDNVADPVAFMIAYRTCCRRLCKALNESQRISDGPTAALLSELGLRLEKQLWLMDASPQSRSADSCRSVWLFLTC
jgi:hypothetical protein